MRMLGTTIHRLYRKAHYGTVCALVLIALLLLDAQNAVFYSTNIVLRVTGVSLPLAWVRNHEGDVAVTAPTYAVNFPSAWTCGATGYGPYTAGSEASLQQSIADAEACRTANGGTPNIVLKVPAGGLYSAIMGPTIPQTSTSSTLPSGFIAIISTQDASLPDGRIVCSHGPQDNISTSTDIGIDNPSCNGVGMYYQLGNTQTSIAPGAFTLANGIATNTSAYNDVQYMYTLEGTGGPSLRFCSPIGGGTASSITPACGTGAVIGPANWLIMDAEIRPQAGSLVDANIVNAFSSGSETSTSQFASHIHFRKDWVHADWTSIAAGLNSTNNAFALTCSYCSIVDSQTSQLLRPGNEGHNVLVEGPGPYKIDHNWFEGQSSSIFAGGSKPSVFGLVPFCDAEVRRNVLSFPYAWLGLMTITGNGHWNGQSIVRKNIEEIKAGCRIVFWGNIFQNSDNSGGQSGIGMNFNVRNFSSGSFGQLYQNNISDLTFVYNILRNSCEGFGMDKSNPALGNGAGVTYGVNRVLMAQNLFYNITTGNPGCTGVNKTGITLQNSSGSHWQGNVVMDATGRYATFTAVCSVDQGGCLGQVLSLAVGSAGTSCTANGTLTFSAPAIAGGNKATGTYTCSGGALTGVTLTGYGSGYSSPATATIATGTGTVTVNMTSSIVAPPVGFQVLDINAGDPVAVTMCTTAALNNVPTAVYSGNTRPSQVGPLATTGSLPWTGTSVAGNLTVTYPWTATANSSDTSGYCTITNVQGGPENFYFQHNTVITDATWSLTSNNGPSSGGNFQINTELRDSIILGNGWYNNPIGEGTATEKYNYDINSLTADHLVWPTRTAANYIAYGHNPLFSVASPVMYFPATAYCTGATATATCVGFVGGMSNTVMPLTLADYHGYSLRPESIFYAGNSSAASDTNSMGANMSFIDAAQTQTTFVCLTPCGTGPYPD